MKDSRSLFSVAAEVVDFELREVEAPVLSHSQRCTP